MKLIFSLRPGLVREGLNWNIIIPYLFNLFLDTSILSKSKRSRYSTGSKNKLLIQVYNKLCDTVSLTSSLISGESLTDHIILKLSQIGISPFFVENVNVLQLEALKVARTIFRNYVKHRDLILDDILASLTRLPSTKRNLRNYR